MPINSLNISPTDSYQLTLLALVDESDYNGVLVNNVSFEVTPPSFPKVNIPFTPNSVNVFTGGDFGLGCGEDNILPDGIYTIKYTVNYNTFIEKQFIRISHTQFKLQKVLLSLLSGDCDEWDVYKNGKLFLEGAVAAANYCQIGLANSLLQKANKIISKQCNC